MAVTGIVVGVDGSTGSHQALEWAARQAGLRKAPLTVLTVNPVASNGWTGSPLRYPADRAEEDEIRQAATAAAGKVTTELREAGPASVTVRVLSGIIADELVDASREADLLVVGSHGHGGFSALLLGSISSHVVSHASCPVVVVPARRD
jgi:nucleotide-binding universal stress UspA family protein